MVAIWKGAAHSYLVSSSLQKGLSPVFNLKINRNLEVDECPSSQNIFAQFALLMNATYMVFPLVDLLIYEIITASRFNYYNCVISLNELIS